MYKLVNNDEEFFSIFPDKIDDLPLGYPCLVKSNTVDKYHSLYYIYIPPKIKCLDSFIAGANAVC